MKASDITSLATDKPFEPTLTASEESDQWRVSQNENGDVLVTDEKTGDVVATYAVSENLAIDLALGGGDDKLTVDSNVQIVLRVNGGSGDDTLTADDSLAWLQMFGAEGNDTLTADSAIDALSGREGSALLFGGNGDDVLTGGNGAELLRGGEGADQLLAGSGTDVIYADASDSSIDTGEDEAVDLVVGEGEDSASEVNNLGPSDVTVRANISTAEQYLKDHPQLKAPEDPTAETTQILMASLGVMLSTESGKGLLDALVAALEKNGEFIQLTQTIGLGGQYNSDSAFGSTGVIPNALRTGTALFPYDDGVTYTPPDVLYHEFVHAYQDLVLGGKPEGSTTFASLGNEGETTLVGNWERQASGLPWIDDQGVAHTGEELPFTQNTFREELGLPKTDHYDGETGDPID